MTYLGLLDSGMFIHHTLTIIGAYTGLVLGTSCSYIVLATYVLEISNPVMHLRTIIRHFGMRYTKSYEVLELLYVMLYIYGRVILGTSVVIRTVTCSENNYFVKIVAVGLALQSYFYIKRMILILR